MFLLETILTFMEKNCKEKGKENRDYYKMQELKEKFRDSFSNLSDREFEQKWELSYLMLGELLELGEPEYTKCLDVYTTFGAEERKTECVLCGKELAHNREFVRLILAIGAVWGERLQFRKSRDEYSEAIDKKIKEVSENYELIKNLYKEYCGKEMEVC